MTKELNLFLGDTSSDIKTNKTASVDDATVKSGKSLFDDLLSDISEENTNAKQPESAKENLQLQTKNLNKENITTQDVKSNIIDNPEQKNSKVNAETNSQSPENSEDINIDEKSTKNSDTQAPKIESKTLSLLDRMMLEANEQIATNEEAIETNIVKPAKNENSENSIKEIATNKEDIPKKITDDEKIEDKSKNNKSEQVNNKEDKSLFDSLLSNSDNTVDETEDSKTLKNENKIESSDNKSKIITSQDISDKTNIIAQNLKTEVTETNNSKQNVETNNSKQNLETNNSKQNVEMKQTIVSVNNTTETLDKKTTNKDELSKDIIKEQVSKISKDNEVPKETIKEQIPKTTNASDKTENVEGVIKSITDKEPLKTEVGKTTVKEQVPSKFNKTEVINQDTPKLQNVINDEVITQKETEVKTIVNNEVQTTKVVEKTIVKNENVANELAKISKQDIETKVNITKDDINKLDDKIEPKGIDDTKTVKNEKSLLDRLVEESKALSKNSNSDTLKPDTNKINEPIIKQANDKSINPLFTNMYLSSQKSSINNAAMAKVSVAKDMVNNASSVKDIEKSAQFLELGLEDTEVTVQKQDVEKIVKHNNLDKLAFVKTIVKQDLTKLSSEVVSSQTNATTITNTAVNENETVVQLNVSAQATAGIESRIIGARQQMGSMMSDVARNMYLNYKPPVTAFKINLLPANLGSIAIMMKSDKENGLSISLNMSNSSTLDSFVDNQASLRAALAKNFNSDTNFSLDFNMQNQNNDSNNSDNQNNNSQKFNNNDSIISSNRLTGNDQEDVNSSYM